MKGFTHIPDMTAALGLSSQACTRIHTNTGLHACVLQLEMELDVSPPTFPSPTLTPFLPFSEPLPMPTPVSLVTLGGCHPLGRRLPGFRFPESRFSSSSRNPWVELLNSEWEQEEFTGKK